MLLTASPAQFFLQKMLWSIRPKNPYTAPQASKIRLRPWESKKCPAAAAEAEISLR